MESLKLQVPPGRAGTEGGRRPNVVPADAPTKPDSEVVARRHRRNLTVAYKLKVLETVAELREQGQRKVGAYLRKEGLYYSSIRSWELLCDKGILTSKQKGSKEKSRDALLTEIKQLHRQLEQTKKRLVKTELIIELQKNFLRSWTSKTRPIPGGATRNDPFSPGIFKYAFTVCGIG